ncbi:MAG: c-type cytochrome domain-containing protein, partial [Sphingobacterium sp.]
MLKLNQLYYNKVFRVVFLVLVTLFFYVLTYAQETGEVVTDGLPEVTEMWWGWHFLGKLHPLLVHFPVALFVIAGIMELAKIRLFNSALRTGINWLIYIATAGAISAVLLGLLLAQTETYGGENFEWHKWAGIITAICAVITSIFLWLSSRSIKKTTTVVFYRLALFITVLGIFITGHYGGSLTHGQDYLMSTTPWAPVDENLEAIGGGISSADFDFASFSSEGDSLSEDQQVKLNLAARTIIAHHCFQCHSSDKMEGGLRLDDKDLLFKGGESGAVILPGDAKNSELVRRISLPAGHKEAMPGKGKPLQENDIAVIKLWVDKGAPWPDQVKGVFQNAPLAPRKPTLPSAAKAGMDNPVDLFVNDYFEQKDIPWPKVVDDRIYLRRIYFDLIGLPPTSEELKRFEMDSNPDKR